MVGDGSWLMMSSEIATSIQEGVRLTVVLSTTAASARSAGSRGRWARRASAPAVRPDRGSTWPRTRAAWARTACGSSRSSELRAALARGPRRRPHHRHRRRVRPGPRRRLLRVVVGRAGGRGLDDAGRGAGAGRLRARAGPRAPASRAARVADRRLRVGVVGAGMIAQVEHIPNLLHLSDRFELVGVADPSARVRAEITGRYGVPGFATADDLLAQPLDALRRGGARPAARGDGARRARRRPARVLREAALLHRRRGGRDRRGPRPGRLVVQVGYMKRFDPNYEAALELPAGGWRRPALHLGRGLRSGLVAVRRPPAAGAAGRRARRPDRRRSRPPARPGRRGARAWPSTATHLRGYCEPLMSGVGARRERVPRHARPDGRRRRARCSTARSSPAARAAPGSVSLLDGAGAVAPRAGARARRRLVPRALHAALRRPRDRARVPVAVPEQPADRPAGAPLGRACGSTRCTCRPATRRRSCASWRGSGAASSAASRCETPSRTPSATRAC